MYLLILVKGKLQSNEKALVHLSDSLNVSFHSVKVISLRVFSNLRQNFYNETWIPGLAFLTTRNKWLSFLNENVGSVFPETTETVQSADSIKEANVDELEYQAEILIFIPGAASFPNHRLELMLGFTVSQQPRNCLVDQIQYFLKWMTNNVLFILIATGNHKKSAIFFHTSLATQAMINFSYLYSNFFVFSFRYAPSF